MAINDNFLRSSKAETSFMKLLSKILGSQKIYIHHFLDYYDIFKEKNQIM